MRILKKILLACFIILLIFAGTVRTPFAQRGIITHFLKKYFNEVYLDKISIGLSSARVKKISLSTQTIDIKLDNASISWSFHDLLFAKKLTINDIDLSELIVSYHNTQEQPSTNNTILPERLDSRSGTQIEQAQLRLKQIGQLLAQYINPRIPPKITIKHIKATGIFDINEILVADVTVECGPIAPMTKTTATIDADISIENKQPISATFDGILQFSQTEDGTINDLSFKTQCNLIDNHSILQKSLNSTLTFSNSTSDKALSITIDGIEDDKALLSIAVDFMQSTNVLKMKCSHNFDIATLSPLFPSQELPRLESNFDIDGEVNLKSFEGAAKCTINTVLSKNIINMFVPEICSDISFSSDLSFLISDHNIRLHSLEGVINSSDDAIKILFFTPSEIIILNQSQGLVLAQNIKNSNTALLEIMIENFNPSVLLKTSSIADTNISWTFDIASKNNTWYITTPEDNPLIAQNLSLKVNNNKYLHDTKFSCCPQFIFGKSTGITINNMQLNDSNDATIIDGAITFEANIKDNKYNINGYIVSNLNKLAHIPYCSCREDIVSGIFSSEFDYKQSGNNINAKTDVRLKSLKTSTSKAPISGTLSANYIKSDGEHTLSMPINIDGQHSTSLEIGVEAHENEDQDQTLHNITATLKGDCLSVPDLTEIVHTIVKLAKKHDRHIPSKFTTFHHQNTISKREHSTSNLFRCDGKIITNIQKILITDHIPLNNFDAFLTLNNNTIELKLLNFSIADSSINAFGTVKPISNKKSRNQQYNISFNTTAECRDIEKLYATILPSKIPAITGTGTAQLSITANETSLNDLMENIAGEICITCNNGTIMPFNLMSMKTNAIIDTIEIANKMIFNDCLFGSKNGKASNIYQLKQAAQSIDYNDINIRIKRNEKGNFVIKDCDIIGPTMHAYAIGNVQYLKHKSFNSFPLFISISCDVAGELGHAMDNLGLIAEKPRHAKYMQGPRCTIKGTVGHPDYSSFIELLYPLF